MQEIIYTNLMGGLEVGKTELLTAKMLNCMVTGALIFFLRVSVFSVLRVTCQCFYIYVYVWVDQVMLLIR